MRSASVSVALATLLVLAATVAPGTAQESSNEELAKKTQNPVADLISVPFQNNFNFTVGPRDDLQYILNIQPVVPFHITENWNLITRTIVPLISQPELGRTPAGEVVGDVFGIGDIQLSLFLSPAKPGKLIWGIGPVIQLPTSSDRSLGADQWAMGPTGVALLSHGPWVYGALVNQLWGLESGPPGVSQMLIQPFVNYNLPHGWYLTSSPIITANWKADRDDTWTVPVGLGVGKIQRFGKLPVNLQLSAYHNIERPTGGPEWNVRLQVQFLFPR